MRSRIASASVGSPITSCHALTGIWLVMMVDLVVRSSITNLQIPEDRHRCQYVKAKVRVHRYSNGELAVFHGPRKLAEYNREGKVIPQNLKQAA